MGVYIKGAKMPSCCMMCIYERVADCDVWRTDESANMHSEDRYSGCPLVEVKETYCRLIDAKELVNRVVFHTSLPTEIKEAIEDAIEGAPTVIEAEVRI